MKITVTAGDFGVWSHLKHDTNGIQRICVDGVSVRASYSFDTCINSAVCLSL